MSDPQWALIAPLLPGAKPGGRPRKADLRRVLDAILYLLKNGCMWANLPHDFPPTGTVYWYFKQWRDEGVIKRIQQRLVMRIRMKEGKRRFPTIAILDSQSVKTGKTVRAEKGYDGGKHVKGRKRHIAVDVLGLPLALAVTSANTHDKVGGKKVIERVKRWIPKGVKKVYADGGYMGAPFRKLVKTTLGATLSIKKGIGKKFKGFKPIAKRWVVERTFAWLGDYRRLDKDQERLTRNSLAMIRMALVSMMLRRLFPASIW
ncbi:MAG TPA: IS5 family transposase [Rhizomicrobium sp.]